MAFTEEVYGYLCRLLVVCSSSLVEKAEQQNEKQQLQAAQVTLDLDWFPEFSFSHRICLISYSHIITSILICNVQHGDCQAKIA